MYEQTLVKKVDSVRLNAKLCGLRIETTGLDEMTDLFETTKPEGGTELASPNERLVITYIHGG